MPNRNERIEYIKKTQQDVGNTNQKTYKIPWRGKSLYLPIFRLDINYLMYSLKNFRTNRQQIEYQENHKEHPNIFGDPESRIGQEAQFEILSRMLDESGKDIIQDLKSRGQEDPAIITYDGFIINGNRRISAMKKMGNKYADCVILSENASRGDLYDIEQELQLSQDFKQEYHWINELMSIDYGLRELNTSVEVMAKRLRIDQKDVIIRRDRKFLIDKFLEWKNMPNRYDYGMLDDTEQAFTDLEKFLRNTKFNSLQKQEVQLAVFNLIEKRPDEGRLYSHINNLFSNFEEIHEILVTDLENQAVAGSSQKNPVSSSGDSLLDNLAGLENQDDKNISSVKDFLDPSKASINTVHILDAINDIVAEKGENKVNETLYAGVDKALRALSGLSFSVKYTRLHETKEKLKIIVKKASLLIEEIEKNS